MMTCRSSVEGYQHSDDLRRATLGVRKLERTAFLVPRVHTLRRPRARVLCVQLCWVLHSRVLIHML